MTVVDRSPRTYVIAGTFAQLEWWCRQNDRSPRDRNLVAVITSTSWATDKLRGHRIEEAGGDAVVLTGTYHAQRYWRETRDVLRYCGWSG